MRKEQNNEITQSLLQRFEIADGDIAILLSHGPLCPAIFSLIHDPDQISFLEAKVVI